jgi:hypothetical protein
MFLTSDAGVWDLDLDFLRKQVLVIDGQMASVAEEAKICYDPDQFGMLDEAESLADLGFVACQRYLSATCGWMKLDKSSSLTAGPKHPSGISVAEVINHAANYWKHSDEWDAQKRSTRRERTEAGMKLIGALPSDYPVSCALYELGDGRFEPVLDSLTAWRDELRQHHPKA